MIAVVRDPGARRSGTVEARKENENLLDDGIQLDCAMAANTWMATINTMTQKFSPSAFHHGSVHGCFSARADLLIQESSLAHKVENTSMDTHLEAEKRC